MRAVDLSKYNEKHVQVKDIYCESFTGIADYYDSEFLMHEYGGDEDGIIIGDVLLYNSQIKTIEEIEVHGTAELRTVHLTLRRYVPEDAAPLHRYLGTDIAMAKYSGWNPYATPEMAQDTVRRFISSYDDEHTYSWVLDYEDVLIGTIGAYDYHDGHIEVGFSIVQSWRGRGFATEALKKVLKYLTENEGISCVTAWCASENIGSKRVLEKSGMKLVNTEKGGLAADDRIYDKLSYEYTRRLCSSEEI